MTFGRCGYLKVISLAIFTLILASCGAGRTTVSGNKTTSTIQDDIIQYGRQYLGKPYRFAGKGPNAFDCSGYTSFIFRKFGYRLHSSSAGQDRQIPSITKREELRKGDLVFFEGNRKNGGVGHVGIVTEVFSNGQFKFIHSSTTNGVIISSSSEPYYASRYLRGGRVLEENASYVTRGNPLTGSKQQTVQSVATKNKPANHPIPEITPTKKDTTTGTAVAVAQQDNPVILVQTDPQKNRPLSNNRTGRDGDEQKKDTLLIKSNMVLREENLVIPTAPKSHTVLPGETLYSISRQYGCTVEQLREWNPQMGEMLKTGDKLRILN